MKKKIIITLIVLLFIVVLMLLSKKIININTNDLEPYNYYAKVFTYNIPGKSYVLKIWEKGWYELVVENYSSAVDGKTTTDKYEGYLDNDEMKNIKSIFEYLYNKYPYDNDKNEDIIYYFDNEEVKMNFEDDRVLQHTMLAIHTISEGNKEYGKSMLIECLNLCN
ncbi:MAG: hypothetical protein E7311_05915 [Clostridiales bacterium]|nr:hypothetical protein [Clostridiales bacterium]